MRRYLLSACAAFGASAALLSGPASAETKSEPVLKTMLEGMPDTEANIVTFDVDPGWKTELHTHPGHLFVYVLEGGLRLEIDGKEPAEYSAGEAFYEMPGVAMVGANASATDRAKFVVFQFGEAGKPLMAPVE